jgi:hypothetical protein
MVWVSWFLPEVIAPPLCHCGIVVPILKHSNIKGRVVGGVGWGGGNADSQEQTM